MSHDEHLPSIPASSSGGLTGAHAPIHQRENAAKAPAKASPALPRTQSRSPPPARPIPVSSSATSLPPASSSTTASHLTQHTASSLARQREPHRPRSSSRNPPIAGEERVPSKAERDVDFILDPARDQQLTEPYAQLGDPRMYTPTMMEKRHELRVNSAVIRSLDGFKKLFPIDEDGFVPKDAYFALHKRMSELLRPNLGEEEATELAAKDWKNDTKGTDRLHNSALRDIIFEFADIWTKSVDATEYMLFLDTLYFKLTGVEGTLGGTLTKAASSTDGSSTASPASTNPAGAKPASSHGARTKSRTPPLHAPFIP